jgi:hypothetical protein
MLARLRSWWQKTSKTLDAVVILMLVVLVALVVVIILGYANNWNWTGLRGKTLYDWLQLLIIPAVLAVGGYLYNFATSRTEREIALDKQREDALQAYISSMSALLLEKNLRKSGQDDEVRKLARVRTLTVLPRLDGKRKGSVLQFLHESGLIDTATGIVNLNQADLSGADLGGADLIGADLGEVDLHGANLIRAALSGANLSLANLHGANLRDAKPRGADLIAADLRDADLRDADLRDANLRDAKVTDEQLAEAKTLKGATMPDRTKHA